jgi:kynurenine formamidase
MITHIQHQGNTFTIDLSQPIDLSIVLHAEGPRAWYAGNMRFAPVINQYFTGSVKLGGKVNFNDVFFNPHAHGTHTETLGHISRELVSIENALTRYWWIASLITLTPHLCTEANDIVQAGDSIITLEQLQQTLSGEMPEALVIRTTPNSDEKKSRLYSNTNFTYMHPDAAAWLAAQGVQHLLVDMPSIDREEDQGKLLAHHAFWTYPAAPRMHATITEMVFVEDTVDDGLYMLNLQVASFRNDAAPSRPVLYAFVK